jgi:DNA repair protein RecN (Recombination protein N)
MIKNLKIRNYTLLKDVSIDFKKGFTVVSGETGAGKSIMLDALALLLGKRVERFSVDKTSPKTIIEGVFSIEKSKFTFFEKNNLDFQELTVVRRELNSDGKSRAFINDTPVLLNVLSEFRNQIIEIHAQHQSILLKDEIAQFALIDELAKSEKVLLTYQKELQKYNQFHAELILIKKSESLSDSELDFLQYQLEELENYNLKIGEKESIEEQISLLENVEGLTHTISESEQYLNNEQGILSQLSAIKRRLLEFETFAEIYERVESVIIELNDVSSDFSSLNNKLKSDPEELLNFNNRLDVINKLLQKHRKKTVEDLLTYQKEIKDKINLSASFEVEIAKKKNKIENQFLILKKSASILNDKRNKILPFFQKDIENHLMNLGMPYARFMTVLSVGDSYHKLGNTSISFLFSANKGSSLLEISKVASGGELSRLMLAIKYISAKSSEVNALVFDEIDIGVSGEIASLMGDMMQEISKSTQLIAISHLPQITSKADEHLKVVKSVSCDETISDVISLNKEERVEEIAKLLSGKEVTSAAFENARVLLSQ